MVDVITIITKCWREAAQATSPRSRFPQLPRRFFLQLFLQLGLNPDGSGWLRRPRDGLWCQPRLSTPHACGRHFPSVFPRGFAGGDTAALAGLRLNGWRLLLAILRHVTLILTEINRISPIIFRRTRSIKTRKG